MKKKFLGIPVVVIVAFLVLALTAGVAYAAVNLLAGGQAKVKIEEPVQLIAVEVSDPGGAWLAGSNTWVITGADYGPVYPGDYGDIVLGTDPATLLLTFHNYNPNNGVLIVVEAIPVVFPLADYSACGVTMLVLNDGGTPQSVFAIDADSDLSVMLSFSCPSGAVAGNYAYTISVTR